MARHGYGKFQSFDEFLASYKAMQQRAIAAAEKHLGFQDRVTSRRHQTRDVVEVAATLREREADQKNGLHVQMKITVTKLLAGDPAVNDDIERVLDSGEDVFVAIRTGDSMGISTPITGLVDGVGLDLKGVWIPKDKAFNHGGEPMSVLHFTHHPVGFICVEEPAACFS